MIKCSVSNCHRAASCTDYKIVIASNSQELEYERRPFCWMHGTERAQQNTSRVEPILCRHSRPVDMFGGCSNCDLLNALILAVHHGVQSDLNREPEVGWSLDASPQQILEAFIKEADIILEDSDKAIIIAEYSRIYAPD